MASEAQCGSQRNLALQWQCGEGNQLAQVLTGLEGALVNDTDFVIVAGQYLFDTLRKASVTTWLISTGFDRDAWCDISARTAKMLKGEFLCIQSVVPSHIKQACPRSDTRSSVDLRLDSRELRVSHADEPDYRLEKADTIANKLFTSIITTELYRTQTIMTVNSNAANISNEVAL